MNKLRLEIYENNDGTFDIYSKDTQNYDRLTRNELIVKINTLVNDIFPQK